MLTASSRFTVRSHLALLAVAGILLALQSPAQADNIYDSRILERMEFTPDQYARVEEILAQSDLEMAAVFEKYGIDPEAKPVFSKLREASSELRALQSRQKRKMKVILTREQYKFYLAILQETAARVIKATRN